jgi:hypothetical protein
MKRQEDYRRKFLLNEVLQLLGGRAGTPKTSGRGRGTGARTATPRSTLRKSTVLRSRSIGRKSACPKVRGAGARLSHAVIFSPVKVFESLSPRPPRRGPPPPPPPPPRPPAATSRRSSRRPPPPLRPPASPSSRRR